MPPPPAGPRANVTPTLLLQENIKISWTSSRIKHAVDLAFCCLKIAGYVSLFSLGSPSLSERYPSGTFPNGMLFNGTYPENNSYPTCIYPCGITPDGTFTTSYPQKNIFKLAENNDYDDDDISHYHDQFPYDEFFLPTRYTTILAAGSQFYLYPCNITQWGDFLGYPNQHPYGEKWGSLKNSHDYGEHWNDFENHQYEDTWYPWDPSLSYTDLSFPEFQYNWFFSGSLINESAFKSQQLENWTLIHEMLENQSFPEIYPWDIYPNGTFGKCSSNFSQPYGSFSHFPYRDFFSGNFSYEAKFAEQLYELYGKHIPTYPTAGVTILTSYWAFNSLAQLILISPRGESPLLRKLKVLALCFASSTFLASIIDLGCNIKWLLGAKQSMTSLGIGALIITYDSIYLTREIASFSSPWVREKVHQIAEKATKVTGINRKGTMLQVTSAYQKSLQNTRIISSILQLLLTGCIALTVISPYIFSDQQDYHNPCLTQGVILAIFTGAIACLLLSFAYFSRRKH